VSDVVSNRAVLNRDAQGGDGLPAITVDPTGCGKATAGTFRAILCLVDRRSIS
jgi:hypothetical protein